MRTSLLALSLALSACAPSVDVVVYADTPERTEQLAATVARSEAAFDGVVTLHVTAQVVDGLRRHDGEPETMAPIVRAEHVPVYLMSEINSPKWGSAVGVAHRDDCAAGVGILEGWQADDRVMAHEFGHLFGLGHETEQHNVMAIGSVSGATLTPEQLDTVHDNAYVRCGWAGY